MLLTISERAPLLKLKAELIETEVGVIPKIVKIMSNYMPGFKVKLDLSWKLELSTRETVHHVSLN